MEYGERPPHPALRPFVRTYWTLRGEGAECAAQPVLPDGSTELIVHRARPFRRYTGREHSQLDDGFQRQAPLLFVGQMRAPVVLEPDGAAEVVAIRFRPHGAFALLGGPQDRLVDEIAEVEGLGLAWLTAAARRAREAPTSAAAVEHLENALLRRLDRHPPRWDARVEAALAVIARSDGDVRVERAAAAAGTSRRHLERLFVEHIGLGPKVFARLVRFQAAAARLVTEPGAALAAVSGDGGYFDQSHMIRDFLAFAGASPQELRRRLGPLTAWMIARDHS
jgi:AraC-like DNA-binding protein